MDLVIPSFLTSDSVINMVYEVSRREPTELKTEWRTSRPHVVILGAGASLAANPSGGARGRPLPLMSNVVDVLGLRSLVEGAGHDANQSFESLYSSLYAIDLGVTRTSRVLAA
jgi:hypothetical protein